MGEGGGCSPTIDDDFDGNYIDFCSGGAITITWTVTDICDEITTSATYTVNPVPALTLTAPADAIHDACEFDQADDNLTAAQAALDANFDAWLAAQTTAVGEGGGCSPTIDDDFDGNYIDFCSGGAITITWTVTDICDEITTSATYTVNPVPALTLTAPADATHDACEFDQADDNLTAAQAALDANFDAWLAAQTTAVGEGGGCSPTIDDDFDGNYIDFCSGGAITITWTVTDICDEITTSATYTVNPVPALTLTAPADAIHDACEFDQADDNLTAAQAALDANFDAWLAAQTTAVGEGGGCQPNY